MYVSVNAKIMIPFHFVYLCHAFCDVLAILSTALSSCLFCSKYTVLLTIFNFVVRVSRAHRMH